VKLDFLFQPKHVAVIGASRTPGKLGHSVLKNLVNGGYTGRVSAINPVGAEVEGKPGYRSLREMPERADCAFLAIPAAAIPDAVRECAEAGVRVAVLGAAGFAELGTEDGLTRQKDVAATARASGLRLVGPNTNGILSTVDRLSLGYNASHGERFAPGDVSFVSHSGALMDGIARRLYGAGGGLSKFIAAGNEADLNMLDYLEYLIEDDSTKVIGLVIEALSDGPRFLRLARKARKPIVALKIGRSALGAGATLAHSSRLAGSARAYEALFREAGVASVGTVEALACGCALLSSKTRTEDTRLVCVSTSGAGGAILADFAGERGMPLAGQRNGDWEEAVAAQIADMPTLGRVRNPIDMGALVPDWSQLAEVFAALERNGVQGPTLVYAHSAPAPGWDDRMADALIARNKRCAAPVLILTPGGLKPELETRYAKAGIPVYYDTATCFDSLQCWYRAGGSVQETEPRRLTKKIPISGKDFLDEAASAQVLRQAGVPMVRSETVSYLDEAKAAAAALGYPVVLKALAPGVAHKNQHGLVAVGIRDAAVLEESFQEMKSRLKDDVPFLVQPMIASKAEVIVGVSREAPLGHFLVFGLGGIHAESLDQVTLLPVPVGPATIRARIESSPLARIAPVEALAQVLEALQALVLDHAGSIDSIDVNPLLITRDGCVAVDALIVLNKQGEVPQ
jgi:acetate---CoA ligase (ADP-forming)